MKRARPHVDINLRELDEVLDHARQAPLSEPDYQKIKDTLHTLVELLAPVRNTEKTSTVLRELAEAVESTVNTKTQQAKPGHGRHAAAAFNGARKVAVPHTELKSGDRCPDCERGKVYVQKEPKPLVRIIGQPPPLYMNSNGCAVMRAGKCSRPKSRRKWDPTSTTKRPAQ
jgi:hypothetical protein